MRRAALLVLVLVLGCKARERAPLAAMARAEPQHGDMSHSIPIFTVDSLRASQRYYRDKLGFEVLWEDGDPADFGAVGRGDARVFMCQRCQGHPGGWIMIFTHDVDALYQELARRGAIIKSPPEDKPWHLREMLVADPDGNMIRFGSATEH